MLVGPLNWCLVRQRRATPKISRTENIVLSWFYSIHLKAEVQRSMLSVDERQLREWVIAFKPSTLEGAFSRKVSRAYKSMGRGYERKFEPRGTA